MPRGSSAAVPCRTSATSWQESGKKTANSPGWSLWTVGTKLKHPAAIKPCKRHLNKGSKGVSCLLLFSQQGSSLPYFSALVRDSETLLAQPSGAGAIFEVSAVVQNFRRQHGHEAGDAPGFGDRANSDQTAPSKCHVQCSWVRYRC